MAFPVQIATHNLPNCFGYLVNDSEKPTLTSQEYGILRVRTKNGMQFPLQVFGSRPPFIRLLLNGRFAERLWLSPGDEVVLEPVKSTSACLSMELVPETPEDWNVVENTACHVEEIFLDQIRVVQTDMPVVLHVSNSVVACFRIGEKSLMDPHRVYYLNNETEVLVASKEDPKRFPQKPVEASKSFTSSLIESLKSRIAVDNVELMKAIALDDPRPQSFRVLPDSLVDSDRVPLALRSFNFVIVLSNGPGAYVKRRLVLLKSISSSKEALYATLISLPHEGDAKALSELRSALKVRPGHAWISNSLRGRGIASYTRIVCSTVQFDNLRHVGKLKMLTSSEFEEKSSRLNAMRKLTSDLPHTPLVLPKSGCDLRIDAGTSRFRVVLHGDSDDDSDASDRCTYFWPEAMLHAAIEATDAFPEEVEEASDPDDQVDFTITPPAHEAYSEQLSLVDLMSKAAIARLSEQHTGGHIMLTGAESSGKTTALQLVADRLRAAPLMVYSHVIDCSGWKGKPPSLIASQLRAATESAQLRRPSIILFDNIDFLNHNVDDPERRRFIQKTCRSIARSIAHIGTGVLFVASAKSKKAVCEELLKFEGRRLFTKTFHIEPLAKKSAERVLKDLCRLPDVELELDNNASSYSIGQLSNMSRRLLLHLASRGQVEPDAGLVSSVLRDTPSVGRNVQNFSDERTVSFADVGGMQDVKRRLTEIFLWPEKYSELYAKTGVASGHGAILHGPSGCGKTLILKALATEARLNVITVKGPELLSKYIGSSEENVRKVFERARTSRPSLIVFDEFDALAPMRGHDNTGVTDRVVNQLLTELDGVDSSMEGVFVVAATNRIELIDAALLRPGRFDHKVFVALPTTKEREEILRILSTEVAVSDDVDFNELAHRTSDWTGAELRGLVVNAQFEALREIGADEDPLLEARHFEAAMAGVKPRKHAKASTDPVDRTRQKVTLA